MDCGDCDGEELMGGVGFVEGGGFVEVVWYGLYCGE